MFKFFALLLVGLVTQSSANPVHPGCKKYNEVKAVHNFNANKFFNGIWHLVSLYPILKNEATVPVCISAFSSINGSKVRHFFKASTPGYVQTNMYAQGFAVLPHKDVGKYEMEIKRVNKRGKPLNNYSVMLDQKIIDTDYENYAIIYFCTIMDFISRNHIEQDPHPKYEGVLKNLGLKLSDFAGTLDCSV